MIKNRRFKIGIVSMERVVSWGKEFSVKLKDALPSGAIILRQEDDMLSASLRILIYHDNFEDVPPGEDCPMVIVDIPLNTEPPKSRLIYNH